MPGEKMEPGYEDSVHDVIVGCYGKRIAKALSDGTIKIIGVSNSSGSPDVASLKGHDAKVSRIAWAHPKFGSVLASCSIDGQVVIWKEGKQNEWGRGHVYTDSKSSVNSVAWAPHELGLCLACGFSDGSVLVFTARNDGGWNTTVIDQAHPEGVMRVSWEPAMAPGATARSGFPVVGLKLASCGSDNIVKVWKLDNGTWKMDSFPTLQMHGDQVRDVAGAKSSTLTDHHQNHHHHYHHHQHRPRRLSVPQRADTTTTFPATPTLTTTSRPYPIYPYAAATPTPTPTPSKHHISALSLPSNSSKRSLPFLFLLLFSLRSLYSLLPFLRSSSPSFSLFPFSFLVSLLSFLLTLCFSLLPSQKTPFKTLAIKSPNFSLSSLSHSQHKLFLAKSLILSLVFLLRFQALRYCGTAAMILAELSGNIAARYLSRSRKVNTGYNNSMVYGYIMLFTGLFLLSISWDRMDCFPFSASSITQFGLLVLPREACIRIWPMLLPFLSGFLGSYERVSLNWGPITQLGQKRVRLISLFYTTVLLFIPALLSLAVFSGAEGGVSIGNLGWPLANTVVFGVLLSENYGDEKVVSSKDFRREFLVTFLCTVVLELLYFPELSLWGILFCGVLLYLSARELDPIYSGYLEMELDSSSEPFSALVMKPIRHILSERKSRKIALFLLINTGYMVVEFVAGFMSNSLGLISDACHMLFDCAALAVGLYASYISRLPANNQFNYGRGRFEVLSGYVNAVFLVLVGALIVLESFERILDPQEVSTSSLLTVSIGGLVVNVIGLIFFHEEHHHAHGGFCSHTDSHSHSLHHDRDSHGHDRHGKHHQCDSISHDHQKSVTSHGDHCEHRHCSSNHHEHSHHHEPHDHSHHHEPHDHSHHHESHDHSCQHNHQLHHHHHHHGDNHVDCGSPNSHGHAQHLDTQNLSCQETMLASDKKESQKPHHRHIDHNMEGIFLHVLADTMGSVGVVISTLLIKYKGWLVADPACSIFISILIVSSVIPLLRNSAEILLQRVPRAHEQDIRDAVNGIKKIKGVHGIRNLHVWSFTNTDIVGTLNLSISADTDNASLRARVLDMFQDAGVKDLTVQLECIN